MLSVYALAVADGFVDGFAVDGGIHRHGMNEEHALCCFGPIADYGFRMCPCAG